MIILDTNALVWWTTAPEKLSKKARNAIEKATKENEVLVSSISIWEVYLLIKKDKLRFLIDVDLWREKVEGLPFIQFIPIDNQIASKSVNLPGDFSDDPADRIIVATAKEREAILITSDSRIRKYPYIRSVW